jgi:hypothetical protein
LPEPRAISSVAGFIGAIQRLPKPPPGGLYAYRGERDMSWRTVPGILRSTHKDLLPNERDAVRELVAVHPREFLQDSSMFDRLVRMQHFGLPTRLLDVTANPLVALFNATAEKPKDAGDPIDGKVIFFRVPRVRKKYYDSDTVSCIANLANLSATEKHDMLEACENMKGPSRLKDFNELSAVDRLLQFVRAEKPFFRPQIDSEDLCRIWYVVPKLSNARIIAQRGAFLIYGLDIVPKATTSEPIDFDSIIISGKKKKVIREQLDILGINASGLFPEIDKAAADIVDRLG